MQGFRSLLAAAAVATAVGACAPMTEQTALDQQQQKTQLVVQNDNWQDIAVYLVRGTVRTRVGTVTSMTTETFTVPASFVLGVSEINVQADLIGSSDRYVSPPIQVFPGAKINLSVTNALQLSSYSVLGGLQ